MSASSEAVQALLHGGLNTWNKSSACSSVGGLGLLQTKLALERNTEKKNGTKRSAVRAWNCW